MQDKSADSSDLATTIAFTDDPLVAGTTKIKAVHVNQLRTAVNAVRALANLSAFPFTDASLSGIVMKAAHINELRSALAAARGPLSLPAVSYTNTPAANTSLIKAIDLREIRNGIK